VLWIFSAITIIWIWDAVKVRALRQVETLV
jgi:hypothetical protein